MNVLPKNKIAAIIYKEIEKQEDNRIALAIERASTELFNAIYLSELLDVKSKTVGEIKAYNDGQRVGMASGMLALINDFQEFSKHAGLDNGFIYIDVLYHFINDKIDIINKEFVDVENIIKEYE